MDSSQPSSDIFSLSDQILSDRLQFIEEIGFGNWGSVWLCKPKTNPSSPSADKLDRLQDVKVAVKLVHRSKTPTTAARVRSLWNEMKIVRSFKHDPHPSIIPFHSFIITPSYALITMAFLPTLVPVEVDESKAKPWFRSLLSGVDFLHKRGVVHNDIKPANILLSHEGVPVLVDFGFAERYDLNSSKAFHSNLAYGTPEYLSPERARGLPHDTRKSDVWSLGITFFEILIGRTPFEYNEGEQFASKEDLEKYWARTLRGKWVGSWKMSRGAEKMLRRMIAPNADLRCTALDAMDDAYWHTPLSTHKRSASASPSLVDASSSSTKLMDIVPPWSTRPSASSSKDKVILPPGLGKSEKKKENREPAPAPVHHTRSKSQPRVSPSTKGQAESQPRKRVAVPPLLANLSPVKASPPNTPQQPPSSAAEKENSTPNVISLNSVKSTRKPFGARDVLSPRGPENLGLKLEKPKEKEKEKDKRRGRALMDLTGLTRNVDANAGSATKRDVVKDRVKDWERERERLREMSRLEEIERERDEEVERAQEDARVCEAQKETRKVSPVSTTRTVSDPVLATPASSVVLVTEPTISSRDALPPTPGESAFSGFKHSFKMSIDKTVRMYKSSTLAQVAGRITPAISLSAEGLDDTESRTSVSVRESWEDEALVRDAKSSLPVCRHAVRNERIAAENRLDRMTIWMNNVEKVVEDARQNFAASDSPKPLPPLPLAPVSRSASMNRTNRSSRLPRKVLAANEIFNNDSEHGIQDQSNLSAYITANNSISPANGTFPVILSEEPSRLSTPAVPVVQTPPRPRRATVTTRSPEPAKKLDDPTFDIEAGSPSKRKEKSKSQGNLFRSITPMSRLEFELQQQASTPIPSPRLSAVLDRSLFIAPPGPVRDNSQLPNVTLSPHRSVNFDELTSSPLHVEPYPARTPSVQPSSPLDSPSQRRIEGVYDRFLMATSGVKRVGKGYSNQNPNKPVHSTPDLTASSHKRSIRNFHSTRRVMPPPVSSEDQRSASADELGIITAPQLKDDGNNTVAFVRRAFNVMTGKTHSRRLSRTVMA